MTDIPIIFSGSMIRALLREVAEQGTGKTMTRRLAWQEVQVLPGSGRMPRAACVPKNARLPRVDHVWVPSPWQKVKPGDRLWVRESIKRPEQLWRYAADDAKIVATGPRRGDAARWSDAHKTDHAPSIHMPRWASRLTLVVTETKIEPLHKISRADVLAEGVPSAEIKKWEQWLHPEDCPGKAFGMLWDSIHGKGEWDKNPDVVALRFSVHKVNIDAMKVAA